MSEKIGLEILKGLRSTASTSVKTYSYSDAITEVSVCNKVMVYSDMDGVVCAMYADTDGWPHIAWSERFKDKTFAPPRNGWVVAQYRNY